LSGTYNYNGMVNDKPSFMNSDNEAGAGEVHINWNGTQWQFEIPGMMVLNSNDAQTELVPQSGWVDNSGNGVATFAGSGTVNNTPTAITDVVPGFEMKLYPNPATNYVMLELNEVANLTIYSTTGSIVQLKSLNAGVNHVDLTALSNGIYMFAIEVNGETEVTKVIKK
ncbi:MAG: T9SS type A sorting domain-containing protein, partial [Bacteroidales bacterium]|nr:T9SS type A sorting domain-containing protein [Bacteroidales bacterium]